MNVKTVVVNIDPDGSSVVDANNFRGVGCKDATKQIELALAGDLSNTDDKKKPDYYATTGATNVMRN